MRKDILDRKDEILVWISENQPKAFIAKELKCKVDTLESYLKKMNIEYKGNMSLKGFQRKNQQVHVSKYLVNGSYITSHKLKLKLFRDLFKEEKCEICGIKEWMGKKAPLELDHIDGNHYNNELSNLRILCPNCHSQTDTNSGKNKGKNK
jgi:5-methylcytosine-specific restriction endonuclease McrA